MTHHCIYRAPVTYESDSLAYSEIAELNPNAILHMTGNNTYCYYKQNILNELVRFTHFLAGAVTSFNRLYLRVGGFVIHSFVMYGLHARLL